MNVDFSKAPGWAIGHALHAFGGEIREVWVGEHQYQRLDQPKPFPYGGGNSDHRHNPRRSEFHFEQLRPAPWTGKGLPPVGTVCEHHKLGGVVTIGVDWTPVKIIAQITDDKRISPVAVYMPCEGNPPYVGQGTADAFRPIRTPEQIAEEEREVALSQMKKCFDSVSDDLMPTTNKYLDTLFGALYDAGYRKQPSP